MATLSMATGLVVPFLSVNFYAFLLVEQLGANTATDLIVSKFGDIVPT